MMERITDSVDDALNQINTQAGQFVLRQVEEIAARDCIEPSSADRMAIRQAFLQNLKLWETTCHQLKETNS